MGELVTRPKASHIADSEPLRCPIGMGDGVEVSLKD